MKLPSTLVIGLVQQGLELFHRVLPNERVVYRIEDQKGKTIGVFSSAKKAELLGEPIEDLLNPRVHSAWCVCLDPMGNETRRGRIHSRTPFTEGVSITGLRSEGEPVEIVAVSLLSQSVAQALATEAFPLFQEYLSRVMPPSTTYAYGRLHDGREGYGLLWEDADRVRVFKNAWCTVKIGRAHV